MDPLASTRKVKMNEILLLFSTSNAYFQLGRLGFLTIRLERRQFLAVHKNRKVHFSSDIIGEDGTTQEQPSSCGRKFNFFYCVNL